MKYVCAFRGRRDSYQVPVALAEAGLLDTLITDHYFGPVERSFAALLPHSLGEIARSRYDDALPSALVRRLTLTSASEVISRVFGMPPTRIYERFDPHYGEVAARLARQHRSNLFMYSPHAWSAFNASYRHDPYKILFQFHPHHVLENAVLSDDRKESEKLGICFDGRLENVQQEGAISRLRGDSAWQLADHVVCASHFTRRSLIEAGASPDRISVAPYGVSVQATPAHKWRSPPNEAFNVLFVGSGLQRKGLHHLLQAWSRARLPTGARLTVVARVVDPGLEPLLSSTPRLNLRRGVTRDELRRLYESATLFCMPSLIEGFGQVFLEALASGVPVLGTTSTCCPDLGTEVDGVYVTAPCAIDELVGKLELLSRTLPGNKAIGDRARACAERFTWAAFRRTIQNAAS